MTSTTDPSIPTTLADVDKLVLSHPKRHKAFPGQSDRQIRATLVSAFQAGLLFVFKPGIVIASILPNDTIHIHHILQWSPGLIPLAMQTVHKHAGHFRIVGNRKGKLVDFSRYGR